MSNKLFKYDSIDKHSSTIVKQRTSEIKTLMRKTAQGIVEIGHKLIEVKEELPHGEFGKWLDAEFDWTDRTARQFMNVAKSFKSENFSDMEIAPSALYKLSSPSTPESARDEAIERAEQGESISHSDAKEIKEKHTPKDVPNNVDSETGEVLDKADDYSGERLSRSEMRDKFMNESSGATKGNVGIKKARKAIDILNDIPINDRERADALSMVAEWINNNS